MPKITKKNLAPIVAQLVDLYEAGYDNSTLIGVLQSELEKVDVAKR